MSRRIAVTGATGFIGRHLVAYLTSRGDQVRAIVRPESRRSPPPGVSIANAPLTVDALRSALEGVDTVVHLAGVISSIDPKQYARVNVDGTRAVAAAACAAGARLIHISSLAAAGPASAATPLSEDDPPHPITPYGESKLASERVVAGTTGLQWTILRPGVVYGPGDRALVPLFRLAQRGLIPMIGRADAAYTFVYVDDVARSIDAAIDAGAAGEIIFVGHPTPVTPQAIADAMGAALGRRARLIRVPHAVARLAVLAAEAAGRIAGRPMALNRRRLAEMSAEGFVCRTDRLRERLGVVARVDLREGFARTAAWYRGKRWL